MVADKPDALVQCHEGHRCVPGLAVAPKRYHHTIRRRAFLHAHWRGLLTRRAMGGIFQYRRRQDHRLRSTIPRHRREIRNRSKRLGCASSRALVAGRARTDLQRAAQRQRSDRGHDETDVRVRQEHAAAATHPRWSSGHANTVRRHARRQAARLRHNRVNAVQRRLTEPDSRRPQLAAGTQGIESRHLTGHRGRDGVLHERRTVGPVPVKSPLRD